MATKQRLLITGVSGLLGNNLASFLKDSYVLEGWYHSHRVRMDGVDSKKVDVVSDDVAAVIRASMPDIVIHCASLTDVDYCEKNKEWAHRVNVIGTRRLLDSLKGREAKFVYISTDSVFDGSKGHFSEIDAVNPLNCYGRTKLEGEKLSLERDGSLVLRTNIFGINIQEKNSIAEWIMSDLSVGRRIKGVSDVFFSSIYTLELARLIGLALEKDLAGIYHCASRTSLTKYDFARGLADRLGLDKNLISPVRCDDFNFFAPRGKNLSLDVAKISRDLGAEPSTIEESMDAFVRDVRSGLMDAIKDSKFSGPWYPQISWLPYGRQSLDDEDISAVVRVLKSPNLTQGGMVPDFEQSLCDYTGSKFCVVFNSGTSALHAACLSAGLGQEDEFITSPNTFVASANCGVYCGARPVFADIKVTTYNLDPLEVEKRINQKTRVVIPVHFAGQICELEALQKIIKDKENTYGQKIFMIEDASHALGSYYQGEACGCGVYSDMTVMSFHPVKHITTGEGGAVLTNDESLFNKLKRFRSHGIVNSLEICKYKDQAIGSNGLANPWYYEQQSLGYNYRMTDIQCALGISQLNKLPFFCRKRKKIAEFYDRAFSGKDGIVVPCQARGCVSNWHLYVLRIDFEKREITRADLMLRLRDKGMFTQAHYIPVHTQPYYQENFGYRWGDYPIAEQYYRQCLSLPLFPLMKEEEMQRVVDVILSELGYSR